MGPIPRRKTERAPAIDKLLKPAVGVALAIFAYVFLQGFTSEIPRVDVSDELLLREVFFGEGVGKNYAVLCHTPPEKAGDGTLPVSSVFQDARNDGTAPASFYLLDCEHVLPSGKSVAERFELDLTKRPTVFVSGKVGAPRQVPLKHLKTGGMLVKVLRGLLEPRATKLETTKALKSKCLDKEYCGLLLKGGTPEKYLKDAMQSLVIQYPHVQFASVDSSVLIVTNLEDHLEEYQKGIHRFVLFKKVSGSLDVNATDNSRLVTSVASFEGKGLTFSALSSFANGALNGSIGFKKIPSLPALKTRTKKMEEAERKKRQRRREAEERERLKKMGDAEAKAKGEDGDSQQKEQTGYDDGRETPEEKAEREARRRKRMQEEAEKWNIQGEDEGEEEDEDNNEDGEESDEEFFDLDGDEDEEDVLDLD
eukprot:CAMPEP_0172490078 /NCGR_PEP_ID=MMETSP1066-20121228/20437_1 /TAXON_ID=671091 /ORGANISM="Coscinodiscus wailesii, Strain CCMP2513" /LENGTH=422 /DNA_ID=CAMNT_0013258383 /DNA_START=95 /DNA_END=1363 /DNA_ORIENTATION=-